MSQSVPPDSGDKLRTVLAQVPEWRDKSLALRRVPEGLTNVNWRVDVEGDRQAYFVKVPGPGTEQFIDRATVNAAARQAADLGVGPAVVFYDPETGIEISEFLSDYRPCSTEDLSPAEGVAQVMGLYRTWHSGPALPQTKTVFDMITEHREQLRRDGSAMPAWAEHVLTIYDEAAARFLASGLDIVPCHNDPHPSNFMLSIEQPMKPMKLIDYDYASNNERSYEIGVFVGGYFLDDGQARQAIEAYYGHCNPQLWARALVMRVIADVKWGLWALVRARESGGDFDYYKYGLWDLRRAHFHIHAAGWPSQIRGL
jgi:thiamine kinase-like enzyme